MIHWIETIKRKLSGSDEQDAELLASNNHVSFILSYENLEIGHLTSSNGKWKFEYTHSFKEQNLLAPLVNFPNKDKVYEQETLWPFFASRIPGIAQPRVQQLLKERNIDEKNTVDLLKLFGKNTISNPFQLIVE